MPYHYFTLEQRSALEHQIRAELAGPPLGQALERLRSPDFGECEACGEEIPYRKLIAAPLARRCPRCT